MTQGMKIGIIGSGTMAEAIIAGLLNKNITTPDRIIASGPRASRGEELRTKFGIAATTDNRDAADDADIVCLCVKPQHFPKILDELESCGKIQPSCVVISIAAGIRMERIVTKLGHAGVVRAMPNTPGKINQGISVWTWHASLSEEQRNMAALVLGTLGEEIAVEDERYLDMATALSGTGPAYAFLFMEALIDAGVHIGFPRTMAEKLVLQTLSGSVQYARSTKRHLAILRNEVTSPGGTTAEALCHLEKDHFRTAISNAVQAAYQRSRELGNG